MAARLSLPMVADALTKSLPSPAQIKHREIMLGYAPFFFAARSFLSVPVSSLFFPVVTGGVYCSADRSPSGRSSQMVEGTTDSVCRRAYPFRLYHSTEI